MQHSIDKTLDRLIPVCVTSSEMCLSKHGDMLETEVLLERGTCMRCLQNASDAGAWRHSNPCSSLLLPSPFQVLPIVPSLGSSGVS